MYQLGVCEGVHKSALLRLVMHLAHEPCFDDLRTKQQLGYLVFSGMASLGGDGMVLAARFIVQSEVGARAHVPPHAHTSPRP